ncbi:hypothetical protein [Phenylobacterium sp.]|uniref:hypothetical protein n=1 Tax=Phenylobacterium sp. TaxID=1871053 RepID=UPI002733D18B|nr:hypothetical protein [Phenylobacterium sp.]MDP3658680.1 hypothetical protein [Phenylobacterium sp.]
MKTIACINIEIPTIKNELEYNSERSLLDYDIIIFNPTLPWYDRIDFSAGGSCISVEGTAQFRRSTSHWSRELSDALDTGKTIFVVLSDYKKDLVVVSTSMTSKSSRNYQTATIDNYSLIPGKIQVRNAHGRNVMVKDSAFKGLYDAIKDIAEYRVVFEDSTSMRKVFAAKDGTAIGGVVSFEDRPGHLVLLPHFDFQTDEFVELSEEDGEIWSRKALKVSSALVGQLIAIDRMLKGSAELTPPPDWLNEVAKPKSINEIEGVIAKIDARLEELRGERDRETRRRADILEYSHLLYETGKPLERAIEKVLHLLGYAVKTVRIGDLEIDHLIVSPTGRRLIGESEGKDSSAIDISKFRQLESNIGEDFEREDIDEPAKGILFGNGFRLSAPATRAEQFTQKSLTNAKRLGSALIRTADLYAVALHLLDHPKDDAFKAACRTRIEETAGGVVVFPNT